MDLVINSRTESEIARTADEIAAKHGVSVTPVAADITIDEGRARVLAAVGQADGVTNAGGRRRATGGIGAATTSSAPSTPTCCRPWP